MYTAIKNNLRALLFASALVAGCGGGGGGNNSPPAADTTPAAFSFVDQAGVAVSTQITSAAVSITGIDSPATVNVVAGSYSVGCTATYITTSSTVSNNQTVCVRHTSAATPSTAANTTLTVGGVSDIFTSTTSAGPVADTTPDAFSFVDQTGVATSTVITSAAVTIAGIDAPAALSVAGGSYSIGCTATFVSTASTINNNQTVCVRHTSSASASTPTSTTLTVGSVVDAFTSTTAAPVAITSSLLPFLSGTGELRLFNPGMPLSGSNPMTVDTGLAPPPVGVGCNDCFNQAEAFFGGTIAGATISNLHASRLAYAKRAVGNAAGGMVFALNITQGAASNLPVRISSLTDACGIVGAETTDLTNVDNSPVVVERAGPDQLCSTSADNLVTVIRLNTPATDAGINLSLVLDAGTALHAQTNALGVTTGYLSFELSGVDPILVRRDANLANPVTLLQMDQTTGANIVQTDLTHLFVTATPTLDSLKLYRIDSVGTLSPVLYSFTGFNAGNPMQDGLRDATHLYFSDANQFLRIPLDSVTDNAVVITTLDPDLRIKGNRALDSSTTPGRLVFDAVDDSFTVLSGVFSAAVNASNVPATTLANFPDSLGGSATLLDAVQGRAYINLTTHDVVPEDALRINTDGTGPVTTPGAYFAGGNSATSFDFSQGSSPSVESIILAIHTFVSGTAVDTLSVVSPVSGVAGIVLGAVNSAADFQAVKVDGLGRYALVRAEIDRFGLLDNDVYFLDALSAGSLAPMVETPEANDIPLGN